MDTAQLFDRMHARLSELRTRANRLDEEEKRIAEQRAILSREIGNLEVAISVASQLEEAEHAVPAEQHEAFPSLLTGSIPESAAELIAQNGGEMDMNEIHAALLRAGKLRPTPNSRTTLWKSLDRRRDLFAKVGRGRWRVQGPVGESLDGQNGMTTMTT